ncbi:MAG: hypothetical protein KKH37_00525 [Alphaproteobacteria bacterium]|jgi:hypothetical protein|nr:hypothetical protein [Alphaproteobacteria bacterium]
MHLVLSAIIALLAVLDVVVGFGFLVNPAQAGGEFGLSVLGNAGTSALRADFTAFFFVAALFMAWGAWRRRGELLLAPLALFTIAFTGRLINLLVEGAYEDWWIPMAVEMVHIVMLALAIRAWPSRRTGF